MDASATRSCDVRWHLRFATAEVHAFLHEHPAFAALSEGKASVDRYRCLLARLYGVYGPLEASLADADHHLPPGLRHRGRSRVRLIAQDLGALGMATSELARLPVKGGVRRLTSRSEALGALYVMQGSALGGRVIARILASHVADGACHYFAGLSDDRQVWQRCCAALEQCADVTGLTTTAVATFRHIADWFTGWPDEQTGHG